MRQEMNRRNRNWQRLQAVLRDRFGLILREETHQLPVYAMVTDKGGAKISRAEAPGSSFFVANRGSLNAKGTVDRPPRHLPFGRVWPACEQ